MKKLKLKGRNSKRLKPKQKERMQKTLNVMQKNRIEDSHYIRDLINKKLEWAIAEREKGTKAIEPLQNQIKRIITQMNKLDGAILVLNELLSPKEKKE